MTKLPMDTITHYEYDGKGNINITIIDLIRCKDCKNYRRWIDTDITFCDLTDSIVSENDYCSQAERRIDEN